jgi:hypothetical protein
MVVLHANTDVDNAISHANRTFIIPYICVTTLYLECLWSACEHSTDDRPRLLADRTWKYFCAVRATGPSLLPVVGEGTADVGCYLPNICLHALHRYAENITTTDWFPVNMLHTQQL